MGETTKQRSVLAARRQPGDRRIFAIRVRRVPVPAGITSLTGLTRPDYADAYAVELPAGSPKDPGVWLDLLVRAAVPTWLTILLRLRMSLARALRLRTAVVSAEVNPFTVRSRDADTVVTGEDDRHLDFRALLHTRARETGHELVFVTVVQRHNFTGRAYFALIRPFHHVAIRSLLVRAVRHYQRADVR